jgi:hypothetical protein
MLSLGWVLTGNACHGNCHPPVSVNAFNTAVHHDGRGSVFDKCDYALSINTDRDYLFQRRPNDNDIGQSIEDGQFLKLVDRTFVKTSTGNWAAPLPFKEPQEKLPNNRYVAWKRARMLQANLQRNPTKREHFVDFMKGILDSDHAEIAPPSRTRNVGIDLYLGCTTPKRTK